MTLRITWKRVLAGAMVLAMAGLAVAWSGVINIGASTGHWAITDWFLHWSMRNTVRTYAAATVDEPATDPTGLVSAAGHYAATCATCHGAPGERASPVMQASTPNAPDLSVTAKTWNDEQLFWIIRNGVKFTPMPAWPALDRDDEIRRMAAFVRRLPGMTTQDYRALAYGAGHVAGGQAKRLDDALPDCERCHADDGRGQSDIPVLAGQKAGYLYAALDAYAARKRSSGVMSAAASRIDAGAMRALANHYASLPGLSEKALTQVKGDTSEDRALAERIVRQGLPKLDLPACGKCHAPDKRPDYPLLSGQKQEYMAGRLYRWQGDPNVIDARKPSDSMAMIARRIPGNMIEPLARFYARP